MRRFLRPVTGLSCLFALATAGCTADTGAASEAAPSPTSSVTAYAPYVSATEASGTDSAGAPTTYNLAFVISDGSSCTPKWDGTTAIDNSASASRISALKEDGASVRVSFGGASGEELAEVCDSAEELAEAYGDALDAAGSTQADFDIEGDALTDSDSVELRSEAIALLQEERGEVTVAFTLPVMLAGLDDDALALLESADNSAVQVSTVNLMTMNYAESYDGDMGDYAITAAKAAHTQLRDVFGTSAATAWGGMALTSMIGTNDVDGETFTLSDAAQLRAFAEEKGVGWVSMWATFRDQECEGDEDALVDCSGVEQGAGAFGKALAG
ncbi:chitinase [Streptomyces sp. TLI_55]|uniref:chitinase n=1 Tax=Streptomyces sp. TLI_55 TaxID=1938861 RepID=UPI000BDA986C|nr:chitinase [Streptomyces sp. TLI_55]SNX63237.1 chitinase [Streptomyces sp. TLI_55]